MYTEIHVEDCNHNFCSNSVKTDRKKFSEVFKILTECNTFPLTFGLRKSNKRPKFCFQLLQLTTSQATNHYQDPCCSKSARAASVNCGSPQQGTYGCLWQIVLSNFQNFGCVYLWDRIWDGIQKKKSLLSSYRERREISPFVDFFHFGYHLSYSFPSKF